MTTLDFKNIQKLLREFRFTNLFTQELGWDYLHLRPRKLTVDGTTFTLSPIAEKRGFQVFECRFSDEIPIRAVRTKIDSEVTKRAYEHLLVFVDASQQTQIWRARDLVARNVGRGLARESVVVFQKPSA